MTSKVAAGFPGGGGVSELIIMGIYREVLGHKTRSISGKVTAEEYSLITNHVAECGSDRSTMTRELWLTELGRNNENNERRASVQMYELFKRTMAATLEHGERFTLENFFSICSEIEGLE